MTTMDPSEPATETRHGRRIPTNEPMGCGHPYQLVDHWTEGPVMVKHMRTDHGGELEWEPPYLAPTADIGLSLRGGYRRRSQGRVAFVDTNTGLVRRPGDEVTVAHLPGERNDMTTITVDLEALDVIADVDWPSAPCRVDGKLDLEHRLLLGSIRARDDPLLIETRAFRLLQLSIARCPPFRDLSARRRVDRSNVVADVCELLHRHPMSAIGLVDIARTVGYSPFHLSRVFREEVGVSMAKYRVRLRVKEVLRRLEQGESDLAALATDTGFFDHAHMTNAVVEHVGRNPSRLRELFTRVAMST